MIHRLFSKLKKCLAIGLVKILGWRIEGQLPASVKKLVLLGVPHTSNWDFFLMMTCAWYYELNVNWLGKESLFAGKVMNFLSTSFGGIKVVRDQSDQGVNKIAETLNARKHRVCLVIAPEGTRSKKPGWRKGFFYIAKAAKVPIGLGYIDYGKKRMGIGPLLTQLNEIEDVMPYIQDFYKEVKGKNPHLQSPVQII